MSDAKCIKVSVKAGVLELSAVVASDVLDLDTVVRHGTVGKTSEDILHFSLIEDYMHQSVLRAIINNDGAIEESSGSKSGVVKLHGGTFLN